MKIDTFKIEYTKTENCTADSEYKSLPVGVVIAAAGNSSRMNGTDKILTPILDVPVIIRTIMPFESNPLVKSIVVVSEEKSVADIQNLICRYKINKVTDIINGGKSRQESVKLGFETLLKNPDIKIVLVHDGARPLVSEMVINRVIKATEEFTAAVPAVPVKDTIKEIGAIGKIESTPDRSRLVAVQTPQGFFASDYSKALEFAKNSEKIFTDDASLMENAGYSVYVVPGDNKNIKITTQEDILIATAFLS